MAPDNMDLTKKTVCKFLRTKMYYVNVNQSLETLEKDDSSAQYWCLKTMQTVGPDDKFVHRTQCCSVHRDCFESSEG